MVEATQQPRGDARAVERAPHVSFSTRSRSWPLALVLVTSLLGYVLVWLAATAPLGARAWPYIAAHVAFTVAMLLAYALRVSAGWLLVLGLVLRMALLPAPAFTTNDPQRYLWDGAVALEGLDPYRIAPRDELVAPLHRSWPSPPEHAGYPTIYPPLAIAIFAASALFGPSAGPWVWKLWVSLASCAALVGVYLWRGRRGRVTDDAVAGEVPDAGAAVGVAGAVVPDAGVAVGGTGVVVPDAVRASALPATQSRFTLALVALNPILLLEGGVGAHLDVLVAAVLAWALYFHGRERAVGLGVCIGLGATLKLLPGLTLLPLIAAWRWKQRWRALFAAGVTVAGVYGAAFVCGWMPLGALPLFLQKWSFGSLRTLLLPGVRVSSLLFLGPAVIVSLIVGFRWARAGRPYAGALLALALPVVASPVLFPWYFAPLMPLLAAVPSWAVLAWSTAAPLTYEVIDAFDAAGIWKPARWPLVVGAASLGVGLLVDLGRREVKRR